MSICAWWAQGWHSSTAYCGAQDAFFGKKYCLELFTERPNGVCEYTVLGRGFEGTLCGPPHCRPAFPVFSFLLTNLHDVSSPTKCLLEAVGFEAWAGVPRGGCSG